MLALSLLFLLARFVASSPSTTVLEVDVTTVTRTTTIAPATSSTWAMMTTSLRYPTPGELATYGGQLPAMPEPHIPGVSFYDSCSGVMSMSLPSGSTYSPTSFCYQPTSEPPIHSKSSRYVPQMRMSLGPAPDSERPGGVGVMTEIPATLRRSRSRVVNMVMSSISVSNRTPSPTPDGASLNATAAEECITTPGGVQKDNSVLAGCGAIFQQIMACYDTHAPWIDPYNANQSIAFQACLCQTNSTAPFNNNSILWRNFTACSSCLETFSSGVSLSTLAQQLQAVENFCCSQNPVAYLALAGFETWLAGINEGITLATPPLTGSITQLGAMSSAFTTTPPLANLAYGASAPFDGTLAGVTPELMTQTITTSPSDGASGSTSLELVTMLVDWVPTAAPTGSVTTQYDAGAASVSAESVAASNLQGALSSLATIGQGGPSQQCHGKCSKSVAARSSRASTLVGLCAMTWIMSLVTGAFW